MRPPRCSAVACLPASGSRQLPQVKDLQITQVRQPAEATQRERLRMERATPRVCESGGGCTASSSLPASAIQRRGVLPAALVLGYTCQRRRRRVAASSRRGGPQVLAISEDLDWVNEETERAKIQSIRSRLADQMHGCPDDMTHDIAITRFLRGNHGDIEKAAHFMSLSLEYRKARLNTEPVRAMRKRFASANRLDQGVMLATAEEETSFRKAYPSRLLNGLSQQGLPVMMVVPRLLDVKLLASMDEKLAEWIALELEWRALALHHLSLKQRRMVKFIELRDLSRFGVVKFLWGARALLKKLTRVVSVVQDFYPEMVYTVLLYNAPPTISRLLSIVTSVLNERMKAKLQLMPRGLAGHAVVLRHLSAQNIWSWSRHAADDLNLQTFNVTNEAVESAVLWLQQGQRASWVLTAEAGAGNFRRTFVPDEAPRGASSLEPQVSEGALPAGTPEEGSYIAPCGGVLCICIASSGRRNLRSVSLSLVVSPS